MERAHLAAWEERHPETSSVDAIRSNIRQTKQESNSFPRNTSNNRSQENRKNTHFNGATNLKTYPKKMSLPYWILMVQPCSTFPSPSPFNMRVLQKPSFAVHIGDSLRASGVHVEARQKQLPWAVAEGDGVKQRLCQWFHAYNQYMQIRCVCVFVNVCCFSKTESLNLDASIGCKLSKGKKQATCCQECSLFFPNA